MLKTALESYVVISDDSVQEAGHSGLGSRWDMLNYASLELHLNACAEFL